MAAPREENQRIDPSIIKSTRSVLLSTSHGLPLKNFTRDYKVLVKSDFPFRECGYSSAMEMLRDMEGIGVVRFAEGKDGTSHLYGVADKGCFMPSWVKKAQVPGNHGSGGAHQQQRRRGRGSGVMRRSAYVSDKQPGIVEPSSSSNRKQNQPADASHNIRFDSSGLVSLFVFWRYISQDISPPSLGNLSEQQMGEKRDLLHQLMSRAGKPVQIIVQKKGYGFVKFSTIAEAERAMDLYNGAVIGGMEYIMKSGYREEREAAIGSREKNSDSRNSDQRGTHWKVLSGCDIIRNQSSGQGILPTPPTAQLISTYSSPPPPPPPSSHYHNCHNITTTRQRNNSSSTRYDDVIANDIIPDNVITNSTRSLSLNSLESDRPLLNGITRQPRPPNFRDAHLRVPQSVGYVEETDDEWCDSLLPPVSDFVFRSSSDNVSLHQMLTVCNGGLGWAERIDGVGRDRVRVKVLKTTSACHCWVQLVDSYELACLAAVERYLRQSVPPSPPHCHHAGTVCGVLVKSDQQDQDIARCWVPPVSHTSDQSCDHVFLIDRGVWLNTDSHHLFPIPRFASSLPLQAIPCVLKGLKLCSAGESDVRKGAALLQALTQDEVFTVTLTTPTQVTTIPDISFSCSTNIVKTITSSSFAYGTQQTTDALSHAQQTPPTLYQITPIHSSHTPSPSHAHRTTPSFSQDHKTTPSHSRQTPQPSHNHEATPSSTITFKTDPTYSIQSTTTFGNRLSVSSEDSHFSNEGLARSPATITKSAISVPNENGLTCVTVSEVDSPNLLWLQLSSDPRSDLDSINSSIAASYDPTPPQQVCVGQLYSVPLTGKYFRVRVEAVRTNNLSQQIISVLCVDTGTPHTVSLHDLSRIPPPLSLSFLPSLALPCHLHGVVTTRDDGQWWKLDNQWLWQNLRSKRVYAYFVSSPVVPPSSSSSSMVAIMPSTPVHLYFDSNGWDSVGDTLVSEGTYVGYLPGVGVQSPR